MLYYLQDRWVITQILGGSKMQVYADNAATTKMSKTAIEAMLPYFDKI